MTTELRVLLALADAGQADIAAALGVSQPLVSMTLNGRCPLPPQRRERLIAFLVRRILERSIPDVQQEAA